MAVHVVLVKRNCSLEDSCDLDLISRRNACRGHWKKVLMQMAYFNYFLGHMGLLYCGSSRLTII